MATEKLVYFLSILENVPKRGFWDYAIVEDLFKNLESVEVNKLPDVDFGVVVVPARGHAGHEEKINKEVNKIKKVILFLMGDEEGDFDTNKIKHPDISIWVQNPIPGRHDEFMRIGTGYAPKIKECVELPNKSLDFFFAGQVTHSRREECVKYLRDLKGGELVETKGFTQGLEPSEYFRKLSMAKIAPCPSGPKTPDSFRLFEALELGCIPIADTQTPSEDWDGFWEWLFMEDVPFVQIKNWESMPGYINDLKKEYPRLNNRIQAWWFRYKQTLRNKLYKQIGLDHGDITVVIPVSPIPSHPNIHILEQTLASVRHHLPECEIILTFDGVREEQEDRRKDYEEHIRRILWKVRGLDVRPYIFDEHLHQVGMARKIIDEIKTPLLLYVEQDTPLVTDEIIEWEKLKKFILDGVSNLIRFHFEARIPDEHKHLMIGEPENGLLKTVQWSQRPHLASTAFYKRILSEHFSPNAKCFIEDLIHGKVMNDWNLYGVQGWNQWRLHIYYPDGNIKRSANLDGREGARKYDDTQIW